MADGLNAGALRRLSIRCRECVHQLQRSRMLQHAMPFPATCVVEADSIVPGLLRSIGQVLFTKEDSERTC